MNKSAASQTNDSSAKGGGNMKVYGVVYLLIDGTNDMEHVGQTTRSGKARFKEHTKADSCIGRAIRAHGADMFVIGRRRWRLAPYR